MAKFGVLWLGTALGVAVLRIEMLFLVQKTACDRATLDLLCLFGSRTVRSVGKRRLVAALQIGVLWLGKFGVLWLGTALGVAVLRIELFFVA